MKKSTIDVECGIYSTEYTARDYGKKIVVTVPYIKWESNNGNLNFKKIIVTNEKTLEKIRVFFENDELINDEYEIMEDILEGRYSVYPLN